MKNNPLLSFVVALFAVTAFLVVPCTSQGQTTLYWDRNGTTDGFGNFAGNWNGTDFNWNSDSTGGAGGFFTNATASTNNLVFAGNGSTGVILLTGNQTAGSIDFANTANLAALQIGAKDGVARSLTVTGNITDTGAGTSDIRVINLTQSDAATVLVANSITTGVMNFAENLFGNAQFFTTGYNITMFTQFSMGSGDGNFTYTQNGGVLTVNDTTRGVIMNAGSFQSTTTGTRTNLYIMNGGTVAVGRLGVNNRDGNNTSVNAYAGLGTMQFNNGTIQTVAANGTTVLENGFAFLNYNGSGTKDMQYDTSKPFTIALSQTGTHTLNTEGATGQIIITPSAQMVNKAGEAGTLNKTGLGTAIFTGGSVAATNSYTGSTTVSAGKVMTDYSIIAGQSATGGTDNLNNGYSAASQLVLNGGNYELKGRSSASATNATGIALNAGTMQVTVGSTNGLVVGQSVTNANLPAGTYIRRIINGTTIELNAMSTNTANQTGQTLNIGSATFANTQTISNVVLQAAGTNTTVTVTPGAGTSTTLLSFGNVSGTGGFTKAGTGTLSLTGSLTYTGPTAVSAGTLNFAPVSGNSTLTNVISGSGTIVKSDAGTTTISNFTGGANTFNGAVIVNGGTLANGDGARGLFSATSFTVNSGGILLTAGDGLGFGSAMGSLTVNAGGIFRGGVQQLNAVTLNGGLIDGTGGNLNVNFALRQDVTVGGSSASTIQGNAGLALNHNTALAGTTRIFNVADATGNANADLTISSQVRDTYVNNRMANLEKTGVGTMRLSGSNVFTGTTTVSAGTLDLATTIGSALGATTGVTISNSATLLISESNQVKDDAAVTLSGGTIQRGAGVSETMGNLNLTADSFLNYGSGAIGTLTFGNYSPVSKLSVNSFLVGNVLRFTNNLSGSINNSSLFAFDNGFVSDWNTTTPGFFTITAIPEPSTVLAALGLSGLMLWGPLRRRFRSVR